jgi:hypothetical protein
VPDLLLIIGSAAAGYLYIALNVALAVPISLLWWFWSVGFDGTHIFATASRTYFDREARQRNPALLYGSLAFFFTLGPVMILLGWKLGLAIIVGAWAYYHVVRQHYGFAMLYNVKHRDLARGDIALDRVFLGVMLVTPPFLRFFVRHPQELGLPPRYALAQLAPWSEPALLALVAAVGITYISRRMMRAWHGENINVPKLLLFAGIVPLHWLTFHYMSWLAAVPTVTIAHNLQYHALVWFHNRNKYGGDAGAKSKFGPVPRAVAASLLAYAVIALAFSLAYRLPGFFLGKISDLAFGFFCGFGLTHYYLDSKIWRVRHDPDLRSALRL